MTQLCAEVAERCVCMRGAAHEGPHVCTCGGAWLGKLDEADFRVVSWPETAGTVTDGDAYAASLIGRP